MIDRRYVYLMIRTKENEAEIITCRKMLNALKVEKKLHRKFSGSRFTMTKKVRYRQWWQNHVKIGIAKNPVQRRNQVSKDIFKSGRTEWFACNDLELLFLQIDLFYYAYKIRLRLLLFLSLTSIIVYKTSFQLWIQLIKEMFY